MPNIPIFDTPALGLRPSETGVEAHANTGRRVTSLYSQQAGALEQLGATEAQAARSVGRGLGSGIEAAGETYVNYLDHKEISAGAAKGTELMAGLTDAWNKTISDPKLDPNDPTIKQKFMTETLEPALQQFKTDSGFFTTQKSQDFAEHFVERFRQHMSDKTAGDMSTLAGIAVKTNAQTTINSLSSMVASDPSSLDFALSSVDHAIGAKVGSSPTLDATTAASVRSELGLKAKQDIVKSAVIGMIQKNPGADLDAIQKKYGEYVSGAEMKMFAAYARQQVRAEEYDRQTIRRREKEDAKDKSTELTAQYLIDVRSKDPRLANDPTAKKILNDPNLVNTDKNNLLNYLDRQNKPETDARTSQETFVGLLRELRNPDGDADAVMQKAWNARLADPGKPGSMTEHDFNQFRQEVVARKTPEGAAIERDRAAFFKNYGTAIAGKAYTPQIGDPKIYNAEMDARRVENDLKKRGLDPHLAYDPQSEYFLGKPERLKKWAGSMQLDLGDMATAPKKREDAMPAIPPPDQRPPGLYETPKGNLRWTGTGWVKP